MTIDEVIQGIAAALDDLAASGAIPKVDTGSLRPETSLSHLAIDSFAVVVVLTELERRFGTVRRADPAMLVTVGDVARLFAPAPAARGAIQQRLEQTRGRFEALRASGSYPYLQTLERVTATRALVGGREMVLFASYGYLGLLGHPAIAAAASAAIANYGTGTHGVRVLAGSLPIHGELEAAIARFKGTEDAILFSSGYVANLATISSLVGPGDVVIVDALDHASIVDGCRLSGAECLTFDHGDLDQLRAMLASIAPDRAKLVVVDAVFSMDGDVVDLPAVAGLCRQSGAWLMVDEAHAIGVIGSTGRGVEEHFGLAPGSIDVKMGTLSKTIPSVGGYVAGSRELIEHLRHSARGSVFSAALPPPAAAAALAALQVIEGEPGRVAALQANAERLRRRLRDGSLDTMGSTTAIVPVRCGSDETAFAMARLCQEDGIFVLPVIYPAVAMGKARLRVTVTAAHSDGDIDRAAEVILSAGRQLGLC